MSDKEIEFRRGHFVEFRATIKVHLGQLARDIFQDEVIEFDGQTIKHNGEQFALPSVRSAIKKGWLVPADDVAAEYVPQPAGVEVRSAQDPASKERIAIETVDDEERVVSTVEGANVGGRPNISIGGQETGEVVGKIGVSAKQKTVLTDAGDADRQIRSLDNKTRTAAPPKTPLSPQKISADKSKKKEAKATDKKEKPKKDAAKKGASKKTESRPSSVKLDGGVEWSLQGHWRERVKRAREIYGDQPEILQKIADVETSQGAKNAINKLLAAPQT